MINDKYGIKAKCIERYSESRGLSKPETKNLFEKSGFMAYMDKYYDRLGHDSYESLCMSAQEFIDRYNAAQA